MSEETLFELPAKVERHCACADGSRGGPGAATRCGISLQVGDGGQLESMLPQGVSGPMSIWSFLADVWTVGYDSRSRYVLTNRPGRPTFRPQGRLPGVSVLLATD